MICMTVAGLLQFEQTAFEQFLTGLVTVFSKMMPQSARPIEDASTDCWIALRTKQMTLLLVFGTNSVGSSQRDVS